MSRLLLFSQQFYILAIIVLAINGMAMAVPIDAVGVLVNCHHQFLLRGIPKMDDGDKDGYYQMEPHFYIQHSIKKCVGQAEHKIGNFDMNQFHLKIFHISGFGIWFRENLNKLKSEFGLLSNPSNFFGNACELKKAKYAWRKRVISLGLALKWAYYHVASTLLAKIMPEIVKVKSLNSVRYQHFLIHLEDTVVNTDRILEYCASPKVNAFDYSTFKEVTHSLQNILLETRVEIKQEELMMNVVGKPFWWESNKEASKVRRILWVVRHAERLDKVDDSYGKKHNPDGKAVATDSEHNKKKLYNPRRKLQWDNSPLSPHGKLGQADKLGQVFSNIPISHIFASPMERTVDTASRLLGEHGHPGLSIKLEPGIMERLGNCQNPPSYQTCEELVAAGYHRLDCSYRSLYQKPGIGGGANVLQCGKEECELHDEDEAVPRVRKTLEHILTHYNKENGAEIDGTKFRPSDWLARGEEDAEHIVLVSHGTPCQALHQIIAGQWSFIVLASISKFVEFEHPLEPYQDEEFMANAQQQPSMLDKFRLIYTAETKHLDGDKHLSATNAL